MLQTETIDHIKYLGGQEKRRAEERDAARAEADRLAAVVRKQQEIIGQMAEERERDRKEIARLGDAVREMRLHLILQLNPAVHEMDL